MGSETLMSKNKPLDKKDLLPEMLPLAAQADHDLAAQGATGRDDAPEGGDGEEYESRTIARVSICATKAELLAALRASASRSRFIPITVAQAQEILDSGRGRHEGADLRASAAEDGIRLSGVFRLCDLEALSVILRDRAGDKAMGAPEIINSLTLADGGHAVTPSPQGDDATAPMEEAPPQNGDDAETMRLPTRIEAQKAAQVLMRCNGADLSAWTDDIWPDQGMSDALRALSAPTEKQRAYPLSSFDALPCSTKHCGALVEPKSVSFKDGEPTVAYACPNCGRTWRIGPDGDETHARAGRKGVRS